VAVTINSTAIPAQATVVPESSNPSVREGRLRAPRRWRRRLGGLANDLRRRLETTEAQEDARAAEISRELDDLTTFSCFALPLIDELESLPISAT
jgi:hypothetical protein